MRNPPTDQEHPDSPAPPPDTVGGKAKRGAGRVAKRWLGKLWSTGGGGFYGLGYLATFLWLEAKLLASEVGEAEGVVDFVSSQAIERITRLAIDSFVNSVNAFLWPVKLIAAYELWGVGMLIVGSVLYTKLLHQPIVDFLGIDPEAEKKAEKAAKKAAKQEKARKPT